MITGPPYAVDTILAEPDFCCVGKSFFNNLSVLQILNTITEDVIEHKGNFRTFIDQVEFIKQHYECGGIEYGCSNFKLPFVI